MLVYSTEAVNEHATFDELALPLFDQLYNFAQWLTQERAEAEDLVQETYVKALRGFSSFQQGTNFRAWMYRILRNTFLTSRTGLRQTVTLDDNVPEPAIPDTPESILIGQVERELLQTALEELALPFREIILLSDVEEMSYQEIAETLSVPIGTVMSRLSRARRTLRELVRKKLEFNDRSVERKTRTVS